MAPINTTWRSYVAEVPAWVIVVGALSVSFWTQVFTVSTHNLAYWESLVWAGSTDAGTIACLFLARDGTYRGTPTWGAWVIALGCAVMSVEFNVVHAWQAQDWLSVQIHVWMPALALSTWYWLLHGRHRRWARRPEPEPSDPPPPPVAPEPDTSADEPLAELRPSSTTTAASNGRERVTLSKAQEAYRKLAAEGRATGSALGRELGVSDVMGRNWRRKIEEAESEAEAVRPFRVLHGEQ